MPMTIPPWIRPASPEYYMQGFSQGEGIAERQNRAEAAIQEMTMRRQAQDQANQLHAVQLATSLQDFALRKQVADEKAREAALKWQGQQKYQSVIDAGGTPQEAFSASAHLLMPGQLWHIPAMAQSQANAEANRAFRERQQTEREAHNMAMENASQARLDAALTKPPTSLSLPAKGEEKEIGDTMKEYRDELKKLMEDQANRKTDERERRINIVKDVIQGLETRRKALYNPVPSAPSNLPKGKLTEEKAKEYLKAAQGNKAKARQMALAEGWEL